MNNDQSSAGIVARVLGCLRLLALTLAFALVCGLPDTLHWTLAVLSD